MISKHYEKVEEKKIFVFIIILRCMAAILITNSHFDSLYPNAYFATGGALGNALFFASSGFCLTSINRNPLRWYFRRIIGIYPYVWLFTIAKIMVDDNFVITPINIIQKLIWPTEYWFIAAIMIFYILYYIFIKFLLIRHIGLLLLFIYILYFGIYIFVLDTTTWIIEDQYNYCKWIYYFFIMLLGAWFRLEFKSIKISQAKYYFFEAILAVLMMYGFKLLMNKFVFMMHFQFVCQVCVIFFVHGVFRFFNIYEEKLECIKSKKIFSLLKGISNITLEIYLVNMIAIEMVKPIKFPLNMVIAIALILLFASGLQLICDFMLSKLMIRKTLNKRSKIFKS
jgi:peptidoglycan/LPS O-acetylase OafA/YrhL